MKISEIRCLVERVTSDSSLGAVIVAPLSSTITALSSLDNSFGGNSAISPMKMYYVDRSGDNFGRSQVKQGHDEDADDRN